MKKFEEVNNDILKDLFEIREETLGNNLSDEDKRHEILTEKFSENILNNVSRYNIEYVKKQLNLLDDNLFDYIGYWNEKYYKSGFVDGMRIAKKYFDI